MKRELEGPSRGEAEGWGVGRRQEWERERPSAGWSSRGPFMSAKHQTSGSSWGRAPLGALAPPAPAAATFSLALRNTPVCIADPPDVTCSPTQFPHIRDNTDAQRRLVELNIRGHGKISTFQTFSDQKLQKMNNRP